MYNVISAPTYVPLADGVYIYNQPPQPVGIDQLSTSLSGLVGTGEWGLTNTPLGVSDVGSLQDAIGYNTSDPFSLYMESLGYFDQSSQLKIVRVTDGTDTSAVFVITDGVGQNPGVALTLTANCTGERPNIGGVVTLAQAATWTQLKPTYRLSISIPYANPEVFNNIVGWLAGGGTTAFDMPTLMANLQNAINNGTSLRGPSKYFIATIGSSTATSIVPAPFTVTTPGTNGNGGVNLAALIGQDGTFRTGMYSLRGTGCSQFALCGIDDPTAAIAIAEFNASELNVSPVLISAPGCDADTAVNIKVNNEITSSYQYPIIEWIGRLDPRTQLPRLVSPTGSVLGVIASQPPENSIGNKPVLGFKNILYTEHSALAGGQPWSSTDQGTLADAGIGYISNQIPRQNNLIGLAHGQNASGISGMDGLNYQRMTNYIMLYLFGLLGQYVDELQSSLPNDPLRELMVGTVSSGLGEMQRQGRIQDFSVTADLSNNSVASIAGGFAYMQILVQYLATARFIIPTLQGGATVLVASASTSVATSTGS
jgi:hypothetical protein